MAKSNRKRAAFALPPARRGFANTAQVRKSMTTSAAKIIKKNLANGTAHDAGHKVLKELGKSIVVNVAGNMIKDIVGPSTEYTPKNRDGSTTLTEDVQMKKITGSRNLSLGKEYTVRWNTGKPTSKTIKDIGRQNGVKTFVENDTVYDLPPEGATQARRQQLTREFGFNQKLQMITLSNSGHWSAQDFASAIGLSAFSYDDTTQEQQTAYLNSYYTRTEYRVANSNKFLPLYCRANLMTFTDTATTVSEAFLDAQNDDLIGPVQKANAMPVYNQITTQGTTAADDVTRAILVASRTKGLWESGVFKNRLARARSVTYKLQPGDILNIDHTHHTGSGARLDKMLDHLQDTSKTTGLFSYFVFWEFWGPQVELVKNNNETLRMIGSGPGFATFEMRKSYKCALKSEDISGEYDPGLAGGGFASDKYSFRTFSSQPILGIGTREFNVDYSDISSDPTATGLYHVPVTTDAQEAYAAGI